MRKTFELPAMQVVEVKNHDMICTSTDASVSATLYNDGTFEEENIFL